MTSATYVEGLVSDVYDRNLDWICNISFVRELYKDYLHEFEKGWQIDDASS